jgi:uncharacterized protein (DUF433 family)
MNTRVPDEGEMRAEYDFSHGERGRLAKRLAGGYDIVIDGNEDHPIHVSAEEVRAGQARLEQRRKTWPRVDSDQLATSRTPLSPRTKGGSPVTRKWREIRRELPGDRAITRDPDIHSGSPVFSGTRIAVKILFDYLEDGQSIDDFVQRYPSVSREQAVAALGEVGELLEARA